MKINAGVQVSRTFCEQSARLRLLGRLLLLIVALLIWIVSRLTHFRLTKCVKDTVRVKSARALCNVALENSKMKIPREQRGVV
jgi:hypothetical protein